MIAFDAGVGNVVPAEAGLEAEVVGQAARDAEASAGHEVKAGAILGDVVVGDEEADADLGEGGPFAGVDEVPVEDEVGVEASGVVAVLLEVPPVELKADLDILDEEVGVAEGDGGGGLGLEE